jgi:hypothetical protein
MLNFLKGMFTAGDDNASTGKVMCWIVLGVILLTWFCFPEREVSDLTGVFLGLLGYALGGKASYYLGRKKDK